MTDIMDTGVGKISNAAKQSYLDSIRSIDDREKLEISDAADDASEATAMVNQISPLRVFEHNIAHTSDGEHGNNLALSGYSDGGNDEAFDEHPNCKWYSDSLYRSSGNVSEHPISIRENHVRDFAEEIPERRGERRDDIAKEFVYRSEIHVSLDLCIGFRLYGGNDGFKKKYAEKGCLEPEPSQTSEPGKARSKVLFKSTGSGGIKSGSRSNGGGARRSGYIKKESSTCAHENTQGSGRILGDLLEISAKDTRFEFRLKKIPRRRYYAECNFEIDSPHQFVFLKIQDMLVSFTHRPGKKRKVLGRWRDHSVEIADPALTLTISSGYRKGVAFNEVKQELHILTMQLVPIRCYLDWYFIEFIRTAEKMWNDVEEGTGSNRNGAKLDTENSVGDEIKSDITFFLFRVYPIRAKIDLKCRKFNYRAFWEGEHAELINLLGVNVEALEVELQQVDLRKAVGVAETIQKCLTIWISDVYERQFYRVMSGTGYTRGLGKVGQGFQNLIFVPMSEYEKDGLNKNFLYSIKKSTTSLVHTIATEILHASHQLTMTIANFTKNMVSEGTDDRMDEGQQPRDIRESLGMAYGALERELGSTAETIVAVPIQQYEQTGMCSICTRDIL